MAGIAYYGSCPSEEFVRYVFADSRIVFFCCGINVASFMNDRQAGITALERWPESIRKRLQFEASKGFCDQLRKSAPTTLVIDFSRATRASLMSYENTLLTVPYELLEAGADLQREAFNIFKIIPFGSRDFWTLVIEATREFCEFVNANLPDTKVILLDMPPIADYRGTLIDGNTYMIDFCRRQMRCPISRTAIDFCRAHIENSRVLAPPSGLYSDDTTVYGPAPMHYSVEVWKEIAVRFHANGGFEGLPRSSDTVSTLTSYSGLMDAFTKTALTSPNLHRFNLDVLLGALPYLFAKISSPAHSHFGDPIDSNDDVAAFRWILGRKPESVETFLSHNALPNRKELRERLPRSLEFQDQVTNYAKCCASVAASFELDVIACHVDQEEPDSCREQAALREVIDVIEGLHRIAEDTGAKKLEAINERDIERQIPRTARQPSHHEEHATNRQCEILKWRHQLLNKLEPFRTGGKDERHREREPGHEQPARQQQTEILIGRNNACQTRNRVDEDKSGSRAGSLQKRTGDYGISQADLAVVHQGQVLAQARDRVTGYVAPERQRHVAAQNEGGDRQSMRLVIEQRPHDHDTRGQDHRFQRKPEKADVFSPVADEHLAHDQRTKDAPLNLQPGNELRTRTRVCRYLMHPKSSWSLPHLHQTVGQRYRRRPTAQSSLRRTWTNTVHGVRSRIYNDRRSPERA